MSNLYAVDNEMNSRSQSISVIYSSSCTRRIAEPRPEFAAKYGKRMVYQETFLDGLHASTSTTYQRQENDYRCKSLNNSKTFAVS